MTQDELRAALLLLGFNRSWRTRSPTYIYVFPGNKYKWLVVSFINDTEVNLEFRESARPGNEYFRTVTFQAAFDFIKEKLT